jgi:hypothetical protein
MTYSTTTHWQSHSLLLFLENHINILEMHFNDDINLFNATHKHAQTHNTQKIVHLMSETLLEYHNKNEWMRNSFVCDDKIDLSNRLPPLTSNHCSTINVCTRYVQGTEKRIPNLVCYPYFSKSRVLGITCVLGINEHYIEMHKLT